MSEQNLSSFGEKGHKDTMGWHVVKRGLKWAIQLGFAGQRTAAQPVAVA